MKFNFFKIFYQIQFNKTSIRIFYLHIRTLKKLFSSYESTQNVRSSRGIFRPLNSTSILYSSIIYVDQNTKKNMIQKIEH